MVKKIWRCIYLFWQSRWTWQTERRTPDDGTGHVYA